MRMNPVNSKTNAGATEIQQLKQGGPDQSQSIKPKLT